MASCVLKWTVSLFLINAVNASYSEWKKHERAEFVERYGKQNLSLYKEADELDQRLESLRPSITKMLNSDSVSHHLPRDLGMAIAGLDYAMTDDSFMDGFVFVANLREAVEKAKTALKAFYETGIPVLDNLTAKLSGLESDCTTLSLHVKQEKSEWNATHERIADMYALMNAADFVVELSQQPPDAASYKDFRYLIEQELGELARRFPDRYTEEGHIIADKLEAKDKEFCDRPDVVALKNVADTIAKILQAINQEDKWFEKLKSRFVYLRGLDDAGIRLDCVIKPLIKEALDKLVPRLPDRYEYDDDGQIKLNGQFQLPESERSFSREFDER